MNTSDFSSSHENMGDCENMEDGLDQVENNFNEGQEQEQAEMGVNANNKLSSGRKPLPIKYYVHTRKAKIKQLKLLSEDKSLSVADRKKYRA